MPFLIFLCLILFLSSIKPIFALLYAFLLSVLRYFFHCSFLSMCYFWRFVSSHLSFLLSFFIPLYVLLIYFFLFASFLQMYLSVFLSSNFSCFFVSLLPLSLSSSLCSFPSIPFRVKVILAFCGSFVADLGIVPKTYAYVCMLFTYIHLNVWGSWARPLTCWRLYF
jgi:hypothetical protein